MYYVDTVNYFIAARVTAVDNNGIDNGNDNKSY